MCMGRNLFINRNFGLLWTGKIISQIGDKFYAIALAWWVLQKTNSPLVMGLLMASSVLPGLIIGPFAGAVIDRRRRKSLIVGADIARGVAVLAITCLAWWNMLGIWQVFAVAVIISLASSFFDPAVQAVIPQIVPREKLAGANALSQTVSGISSVMGPLLGALSVSCLGITTVFLANGISYLVSAVCGGMMNIPATITEETEKNRTWLDVKEGLRFLIKQTRILIIIIVIGIAHFFIGCLMVVMPFLARGLAGSGVRNLGYLETMMGLGLILGSLYVGFRKKGSIRDFFLFLFLMVIGACYVLIGVMSFSRAVSVVPYMAAILFVGAAIANASIYWQSLLQLNTPNEIAGRIFSISSMMGNISLPLAYGIFGILLKAYSMARLMLFSGICLVILSMMLMFVYRKNTIRQLHKSGVSLKIH